MGYVSQYGKTFASIAGDKTVMQYLSGIEIFPGAKSCEIRLESGPNVAVSENVAMAALTDGLQLAVTDSHSEGSKLFDQVDLGNIHIYAGDTTSKVWIGVRGF